LIDEGEKERGVALVQVSVALDRKGEARPRAVPTGLSLAGETFPKPFVVGITSKVDVDVVAGGREVVVMDDALPKILGAEETGDVVSDLYDARATTERVVTEPAADKGVERPENAVTTGGVLGGLILEAGLRGDLGEWMPLSGSE